LTPTVSIGLPVFNGERYLAESIESILGQSYTDLELIICDNASTDSTPEIIERYAQKDDRVRVYTNPTNIGGARNANKAFDLARGRYYRLASHDDVCLPTMIEEYVRVLDINPEIVVCYSAMLVIDEDGGVLRESRIGRGMAIRRSERFREISSRHHVCEPIYGLMRTDVLRQVRPHGNYVDSDRVMLTELALRGRFFELPTPLFCKRFHPKNVYSNWAARMSWYNPSEKSKITLPFWIVLGGLASAAIEAPISLADKGRCLGLTAKWAVHNGKLLTKDLAVAAVQLMRPLERRAFRAEDYNWE
jgi:glycosyltransferase involved in cell wall biosynthesis